MLSRYPFEPIVSYMQRIDGSNAVRLAKRDISMTRTQRPAWRISKVTQHRGPMQQAQKQQHMLMVTA